MDQETLLYSALVIWQFCALVSGNFRRWEFDAASASGPRSSRYVAVVQVPFALVAGIGGLVAWVWSFWVLRWWVVLLISVAMLIGAGGMVARWIATKNRSDEGIYWLWRRGPVVSLIVDAIGACEAGFMLVVFWQNRHGLL